LCLSRMPTEKTVATSRLPLAHPTTQAKMDRAQRTYPWRLGPTLWPSPAPTV
jgi:hypothetical protein